MTFRLLSAIVLSAAAAAPVAAQSDQPTGTGRATSILDANVDLFGTLDRAFDATAQPPGTPANPFIDDRSRNSWGGNSSLLYTRNSSGLDLTGNFGASVRRFGVVDDELQPGYLGAVTASGPWGRRSEWTVNTSFSYGPASAAGFLDPAAMDSTSPSVPLPDYGLANQDQLSWNAGGSLSHKVSRRGSLSGTFMYSRSKAVSSVIEAPETEDTGTTAAELDQTLTTSDAGWFQGWNASGRYSHQTSRYLTLHAGYGLAENTLSQQVSSQGGAPTSARLHTIDSGVGYARPLSFSRRTRISTQLGSSIVRDRLRDGQEWVATGNASLRHELGRTWIAQLAYTRDTRFVPTFVDPIVNSGVSARVGGNMSRRSALNLLTNYSTGTVGIGTGSNGFRMRTASLSYRYAFLRRMAAYVEYFLFDFDFDDGVQLANPLPAQSGRHGVRLGVSIGTGLIGRQRGATVPGEGAQ